MLNGLSLFSGIGGIDVALSEWVRPVAYCEIDRYCQGVLFSRMATGDIRTAPIWDDITTLDGSEFESEIDVIYGGFPCQDISVAGHGKGLEGERSGLFYEIVRLCREIKPRFIFLENVPAITSRGGTEVVREITSMGYDCRWCIISAASIGALHRRERWFLLAHSKHNGASSSERGHCLRECTSSWKESQQSKKSFGEIKRTSSLSANVAHAKSERLSSGGITIWNESDEPELTHSSQNVANTKCAGLERHGQPGQQEISEPRNQSVKYDGDPNYQPSKQTHTSTQSFDSERRAWGRSTGQYWPFESREHWQETVSSMGKCSHGIPFHVDRLRSLGNAVVPQQVKEAFQILIGLK